MHFRLAALTRRHFLQGGAVALAAAALPRRSAAAANGGEPFVFEPELPDAQTFHPVVHAALDAARQNGATFADVQVRFREIEYFLASGDGVPSLSKRKSPPPGNRGRTNWRRHQWSPATGGCRSKSIR
jgi:hypothetical protein